MTGSSPSQSPARPAGARGRARRAVSLVQGVGFWTAVVLPFLYLPLLAVAPPSTPRVLVAAVALNAVALVVGHGYAGRPFPRSAGRRSNA